jgi:hypothetical protein
MTQVPAAQVVEAARRVRDGVPQSGDENIHPEWRRMLGALAAHIITDDIETFTRWRIIAQTMFIGDHDDTARQLAALQARPDWRPRWEPALVESPVGAAPRSSLLPSSSGNQIRQAYVLARFEAEMGAPVDAFDQVVEFGGGFGAMCLLITRLGFTGRYVIVDNEPVRSLQRWYLSRNGLAVRPDGDLSAPSGVCTVASPALAEALDIGTTLRTAFLANWSLSETAPRVRDQVFRSLRDAHVDAIWATYQKAFGIDNAAYFTGTLREFCDVYEASVRPLRPDAGPDDDDYGHGCLALKRVPGRRFPASVNGLEPAPFETSQMRHITMAELIGEIRGAIAARRPLSVVRLGDGEARVIGYPRYVPRPLVADIWQTWFGRPDFTDDQLERVRSALKRACLDADVIGVPHAEADIHSEFGRVKALLPREGFIRRETRLCSAGFHLRLQREDLYPPLLSGLSQVGLIGPRDLTGVFPAIAGVPGIIWLQVPPEMKFSDLPDEERVRLIRFNHHLTNRYLELMDAELPRTLERWPGLVILVGAGVLGKIYCHRIKQLGGIGIDVGSMMDVWAGLKTRDNQKFDGLRVVEQ